VTGNSHICNAVNGDISFTNIYTSSAGLCDSAAGK